MMIDKFLQYIKYEKAYSSHTFVSYQSDLMQFERYCREVSGAFEPQTIDSSLIRDWVVSLMESGDKATSINRKLTALRSFYNFLKRYGYVKNNPMKVIVALKREKLLPKFMKEDEMERLLEVENPFDDSFEGIRDNLIIDMFYSLGIRLSELIGIKDSDVDLNKNVVLINGKRNKQRLVPFGNYLKESILQYIKERDANVEKCVENFFVKKDGKALYTVLVYRVVKRYLGMVTTQSKRSPHVLRHTFATSMLNNGAELNAVKELLGHASLAATEVYTHTTFEQLQKIYKQAHPRA